ncbi:hypothetical protein [Actinomadura sp. DC4]|uniref:hypothetical protein n=1 Tax=Actinomadura sp. DC4 TaxID=3055069 RepID=UPI0025B0C0F9|nr:hypothetical protein [Actinomadura sp. DC4]MDN3356031.1 hypothetical protein [Actinomadura sp. DC4]
MSDEEKLARPEEAEQIIADLFSVERKGLASGHLTKGEVEILFAIRALLRDRLGERGGNDGDIDLKWLGQIQLEHGVRLVKAELKPVRHTAPIVRLHADGTECNHKISPSGQPRPGQGCPGPPTYSATCKATGCGWESTAGIRAIVEDAKRTHLHANPAATR